ncbi:hypothetical protein [Microbacterium gorillae]|uniref:hypothetical protein n=1 Tax=Microbacterium gorillae TaxID=1231063 RepID=UPI003D957E18
MEPLVSWTTMGAMALAALVLVLTPGPNMIYLICRDRADGRWHRAFLTARYEVIRFSG